MRGDLSRFDDDIESIFIEIEKDQNVCYRNIVIGVIYHPPNHDLKHFTEKVNDLVHSLKSEKKCCYLSGDYNIKLLNYDQQVPTGKFVDMLSSNSFVPLITRPTRVTPTSATFIDNIFTNNIAHVSHCMQRLLVTDVSDHYPIFHIDREFVLKENDGYVYKRLFTSSDKDSFHSAFSATDWNEMYRASDTQGAFDIFHNQLVALFDKHFPKVKVKRKYNNKKPWLSEALKNSLRYKNKFYSKSKRVKSAFYGEYYKQWKWLKSNITMNLFWNIKMTWRDHGLIKDIINRNKKVAFQTKFRIGTDDVTTDKNIISNKFNDFFINIGHTLARSIPDSKKKNHIILDKVWVKLCF